MTQNILKADEQGKFQPATFRLLDHVGQIHRRARLVQRPRDDVAGIVLKRFGDVVDRFNFYAPYPMEPERWAEVLAGFK